MDLFDHAWKTDAVGAPLADRMRPRSLDEILGQDHFLGTDKVLRRVIESDQVPSLILWGPPGSGKTTIAMVIAGHTGAAFHSFSAVTVGIKELRGVIAEARELLKYHQRRTILFIDEIHRFNKAQQDAFLPFVERGTIILMGATTENPSFEVNSALLSRRRVFVLKSLADSHLRLILRRALTESGRGLGDMGLEADDQSLKFLAESAHGDARTALNGLEMAANLVRETQTHCITLPLAEEAVQQKTLRYDKSGEEHYNLISALHKSIRGSDPDAALYWLGRMLEAGEDARFLLRRMARMAGEDIGLADPRALLMAAAAQQTFDFIGLPEGKLALAELAVYLALAPKSNALEAGYEKVRQVINQQGELEVPLHIRNAPTSFMRSLGYGQKYRYAHDYKGHWIPDDYLPDKLREQRFYQPGNLGWEGEKSRELEERLQSRRAARKKPDQRPEAIESEKRDKRI